MPIPALTDDGLLPTGVHDCSLDEVQQRFGQFQRTDRRCRLMNLLTEFVRDATACQLIKAVIVDGSFVTAEDEPGDIDLILVVPPKSQFPAVLRPFEYNAMSRRHIQRHFGFDALIAQEGEMDVAEHIEFFAQIRGRPDLRKGMLRITI